MRRRRAFVLLAAVLALLALAACGGGDDQGAPEGATTAAGADASVLAAAAESAVDAGSSKVSVTITVTVPGQEAPATMRGEGEFDYEGRAGRLTFDAGDLLQASGLEGADEPIEVILDGDVVYMKYPLLTAFLPDAKPWLKLDVANVAEQQGIDLSQFQQLNQNPAETLDYLRATANVEEVGTETIDGVETTKYRGVVEFDKVADFVPEADRAELEEAIDQLKEQTGLSELPVEVWVDDDGLPRRISYAYDAEIQGQSFKAALVMDFSDYGVEVSVEPPPADQVSDLGELLSSVNAGATTG